MRAAFANTSSPRLQLNRLSLPSRRMVTLRMPVTAMQWDPQAVRAALAAPGEKTSRRLLSELCEDFRREKPEEWKQIEAAKELGADGILTVPGGMGGGVTIDLIHEWDYLVELFGVPSQVYNLKGTFSHLEIDSDDLSVYIARYPGLLAEVHLDYFGRTYRRSIELFCKEGTVTADFGAGTLTLDDGTVRRYEEPVNRRYEREMEYFVDYARNGTGESVNPPRRALEVLALTQGETLG